MKRIHSQMALQSTEMWFFLPQDVPCSLNNHQLPLMDVALLFVNEPWFAYRIKFKSQIPLNIMFSNLFFAIIYLFEEKNDLNMSYKHLEGEVIVQFETQSGNNRVFMTSTICYGKLIFHFFGFLQNVTAVQKNMQLT